jgi:hypothetical protein
MFVWPLLLIVLNMLGTQLALSSGVRLVPPIMFGLEQQMDVKH